MKKLLFVLLLALVVWKGYGHFVAKNPPHASDAAQAGLTESQAATVAPPQPASRANTAFKCDGRQHCSQMTSRAEAEFFVRNCPDTKMDGDNDGEPCENDSRF